MKEYLLTILKLSQPALLEFLVKELNKLGIKTKSNGKWIYHKGTYPVMLVAHLDTVHRILPTDETIFYSKDGNILNCVNGIGGDDRCGVAIIMELIKRTKLDFSILFTTDEEIGAVGAGNFVQTHSKLRNVNAIVEYDRRGSTDVVRYDDTNLKLTEIVEKYGFARNTGSFSDIVELSEAYGVSSVNISSGYFNEHSHYETIDINVMEDVINKSISMFTNESFEEKIIFESMYKYGGVYSSGATYYEDASGGYWKYDPKLKKFVQAGKKKNEPKTISKISHIEERGCYYCDSYIGVSYYKGYGYLCADCAEELGLIDEDEYYNLYLDYPKGY